MALARFLVRSRHTIQRSQAEIVRTFKQQQQHLRGQLHRTFAFPAVAVKTSSCVSSSTAAITWPSFTFPWTMADTEPSTKPAFLNAKHQVAPSEDTAWPEFIRWTPSSPHKLREVEQRLLKVVSTPQEQFFVDIGQNRHVNTIKMGQGPPLVMVHGWAGAAGIFVTNFDEIAKHHTIYAIDLIGFGRSSRPPFKGTTPEDAEAFFLESLEAWRASVGLDKFALLGHSMGGYLSGLYALAYPEKLSHLVLADPWGVPAAPEGWDKKIPTKWKILANTINTLAVSPLSLLRAAGPFGPALFKRTRPDLANKFSHLFDESDPSQATTGVEYIYHINAQRPSSGEEAFRALTANFAWAARPLDDRLHTLDSKVPVTFIYGDSTWMDQRAGFELKERMRSPSKMVILPDAGHHVYIDNSDMFNKAVLMGIQGTLPDLTAGRLDGLIKSRKPRQPPPDNK